MNFKKFAAPIAAIISVLCFGFTNGAFAADWQFYGAASVNTFWSDSDLNDTTQFSLDLNAADIGAEVSVSDSLMGAFEYTTEDGNVSLTHLYGEWNFGSGSLLVGQAEVPAFLGISEQAYDGDRALEGLGEFNPGERAVIRLAFGDFEIAAVEPDIQVDTAGGLDDSLTEVKIPAIHAKYTFSGDTLNAGIAGAYASFDYDDESVTSYVALVSVDATVNRFRMAVQAWFGQNVGNIAPQDTRGDFEDGYAIYEGGQIEDVDAWGAALVVQMVLNDTFSFEAGYGYVDLDYGDAALYGSDDDKVQTYYLNMPITLAEGVQIVPEIGVIDYYETGQDEITYGGAKWQIEF
ncbi:MAG: hypothetical protein MI892_22905 [Desulfobacterales bacterium]|nr:hypothetical protein [Desulfobacterales bacterium]